MLNTCHRKRSFGVKLLYASLLTSSALAFSLTTVKATDTLFEDDFENPSYTESSWTKEAGVWNTSGGDYSSSVTYDGSDHWSLSKAGSPSWSDYTFHVDIKNTAGADKVVLFRYKDFGDNYAVHMVGSPFSQNYIRLNKSVNGQFQQLALVPFLNTIDTWYSITIVSSGSRIKVYVNGNKLIDFDDVGTTLTQGQMALYVWSGNYAGYGSVTTSHFDNVSVTDLSSSSFPTPLPIPLLKQTDSRWGSEIYDHAPQWASPAPPTISHWGCTITSAAMAFLFHGINKGPDGSEVTPKSINAWLLSTPDGYVNGGNINWWALRRFTRLANNQYGSPILDFRKLNNFDSSLLAAHLSNHQPDIIGVNGNSHFVVATGQSINTYFVNDPYYSKTELSEYNQANSMMHYFPTNTNLSTLYLTVNPPIELFLTNPDGLKLGKNPSTGDLFTQTETNYDFVPPISDEESNQANGPGFQELALPLPSNSTYTLNVWSSSISPFSLKIIGYNKDGDPFIKTISGIVDNNSPSLIKFDFSQADPSSVQNATRTVTFESFRNDIHLAYNLNWITTARTRDTLIRLVSLLEKHDKSKKGNSAKVTANHFLNHLLKLKEQNRINEQTQNLLVNDLEQLGYKPKDY